MWGLNFGHIHRVDRNQPVRKEGGCKDGLAAIGFGHPGRQGLGLWAGITTERFHDGRLRHAIDDEDIGRVCMVTHPDRSSHDLTHAVHG